jgi:hypothetical protein
MVRLVGDGTFQLILVLPIFAQAASSNSTNCPRQTDEPPPAIFWLQDESPPEPVARIGACNEITALAYLPQAAALPGMWAYRKLALKMRQIAQIPAVQPDEIERKEVTKNPPASRRKG